MAKKGKVVEVEKPARANLRLSPEKAKVVLAAVEDLGITNITTACNYLLNKGLEQSLAMAAVSRAAGMNKKLLELLEESKNQTY